MNAAQKGFLLLTSHLGDPECKPLTVAQFRTLTNRARGMTHTGQERALNREDLISLGYTGDFAENILFLLSREDQLEYYVNLGKKNGCYPITRNTPEYPARMRDRLGADSPGSLWCKGDASFLNLPSVSLVGSRQLRAENLAFAAEVGRQAALQGYVLVSGNAKGADRTAQESCINNGGKVVSIIADSLEKCPPKENVLYLSEDGYHHGFSAIRALSRNRLIHAQGLLTFVAQCRNEIGGTWQGTVKNLRNGISPVFCFQDGSDGIAALLEMGATAVDIFDLSDFAALQGQQLRFL